MNQSIAVVVLNWNGKNLLQEFLPSVVMNSKEAVMYLVDNQSTDDSLFFVKTHFPSVKIIQNKANFGYAKGYNEALNEIEESIYVLINSDVEVTENWLLPVVKRFENEPNTAIIQPKIKDYKNKNYFEYAGAAGGFIDKYGYPFCRGRIFEVIEKDENQYNTPQKIFWASGACLFIRRSVFREMNGFDADFYAHQEEIDLCWRVFNKNYDVKFESQSVVFHLGGGTLQYNNPRKTYLNFRNSLFMLTKNLPSKVLFKIIIIRMLLDGLAAFQFLAKGKSLHFFAVLKAHFSFYRYFLKNYRKRVQHQNKNYYFHHSIVYSFFWRKIKKYNQL
jgi:GT2 family glycosyltransferase